MARSEAERQYNRNNRSYRLQCQFKYPLHASLFVRKRKQQFK